MPGILKRRNKNGTYSYRAQVRLKDGMPHQSKTFPTLVEARAWKTQEEAKRRQGMYLPSMTSKHKKLYELIDRYIQQVLPSKPKNASNVSQHLSWWKKQLGDLPLNRLTSDVIATTRNKLLEVITPRGTKLSPKTANRYLASLSVNLTYGVEECGWLHMNPCIRVTKFNEGSSRNRILTPEEIDKLLEACKRSRCKSLYPIIFLAMRSGMRLGELLSLTWADVDLNQNIVFLRETKSGVPRSVPLSKEAKLVIEGVSSVDQRKGLVFKGRRFGRKPSIRKPFYTALALAGIEDLHIHDLRHLFCTTAAKSGASVLQIKSITGHSTMQTLDRYTHIEGVQLKHIVDDVDKALRGESE
jgi:integrase